MLLLFSHNFCESMPVTLPMPNRAKKTLYKDEKKDVKAKFLHLGVGLKKKLTSPTRNSKRGQSLTRPKLTLSISKSANTCHRSPRRLSCSITSPLQSPNHHTLSTPIFTPDPLKVEEPSFTNTERRQQEDVLLNIDFSSPLGRLISQEVSETLKKKLSVTSDYEEYCKESSAKDLRVPRTIPGPWAGTVRNNRRHKNPKRTHYLNSRQRKERFLALRVGIHPNSLWKRRKLIQIQRKMQPCYVKMIQYPELDRIIQFLHHPHLRIKITDKDTTQPSKASTDQMPIKRSTHHSTASSHPVEPPEVVDLTAESDDETSHRKLTASPIEPLMTCEVEENLPELIDDELSNRMFVREISPSDFDNEYSSMVFGRKMEDDPSFNPTSPHTMNHIGNQNGETVEKVLSCESSFNTSVSSSTSTDSTRRTNRARKFPIRFEQCP